MSASIDTYRSIDVGTANPRLVLLRVYEEAIGSIGEAEASLRAGESCEVPLGRVRSLVGALLASLDFDSGDIAQNLLRLYLFVLDRIHETVLDGRDHGLTQARRVLETLQAAWQEMPAEEARLGGETAKPVGLSLKG